MIQLSDAGVDDGVDDENNVFFLEAALGKKTKVDTQYGCQKF